MAAGTLWLFLAALPALADGGPHVSTINNGSLGINADSCAGCHRAHTAQGPMLINAADEEALCLTCHGSAGVGSTLDVMTGVQYKVALPPGTVPGQDPTDPSVLLGALRNGGFDEARLDAGNAARRRYDTDDTDFYAKVGVGAPEDVTSAHLSLPDNGLTMPGVAWGNGADGSGAGPVVEMSCASCHNPHGNGQYRILNPIPVVADADAGGTNFVAVGTGVTVTDSPVDNPDATESDVKNYTVIQTRGTPGNNSTYLLYADDVLDAAYGPTTGDYFHRYVPWNPTSTATRAFDAPNGRASTFNTQMTSWCLACHSRYYSVDAAIERTDPISGLPDTIYRYQHQTVSAGSVCTTCHVSHGSNAATDGFFSGSFPYPDSTVAVPDVSGSSRLLKIDDRGTCQACHDPTDTVDPGDYTGPIPTPGIP
jgi:predicted CXXCH cytochrome family protein